LLDQFHPRKDVSVFIPLDLLEKAERTQRLFTLVLGAIAMGIAASRGVTYFASFPTIIPAWSPILAFAVPWRSGYLRDCIRRCGPPGWTRLKRCGTSERTPHRLLAAPLAAVAAVPGDLLARTMAFAAAPWSKALPTAVLALAGRWPYRCLRNAAAPRTLRFPRTAAPWPQLMAARGRLEFSDSNHTYRRWTRRPIPGGLPHEHIQVCR
jgi:hypothetical protein